MGSLVTQMDFDCLNGGVSAECCLNGAVDKKQNDSACSLNFLLLRSSLHLTQNLRLNPPRFHLLLSTLSMINPVSLGFQSIVRNSCGICYVNLNPLAS